MASDAGAVDEEGVPFGPRLANLRQRWHVVSDPEVTADDGVMAYADATEDGGVGIDGDVVLDDGMAGLVQEASVGIVLEVAGAEGDALIEHDVMADDGGGSDLHSLVKKLIKEEKLSYTEPIRRPSHVVLV